MENNICPLCLKLNTKKVFSKLFCSKKCYRKKYYLDHKNHENENAKKWYQRNRESEIKKNIEYRKNNRSLFDWYHNRDRFSGLRNEIIKRDNNCCRVCSSTKSLSVHHKDSNGQNKPKEQRNNKKNNLITLCHCCHIKLHHWQRRNNLLLLNNQEIIKVVKKLYE